MIKSTLERVLEKIDDESHRLSNNPQELAKIEDFIKNLGDQPKPIFAKVSRKVYHDFCEVCAHEDAKPWQVFKSLVEEYAKKKVDNKREYDPALDYKGIMSRNQE